MSHELDDGFVHIPVMPREVLAALALCAGDVAVDGTTGLGGHSRLMGEAVGAAGRLVCFDRDPEALALAEKALHDLPCTKTFINRPFEFMAAELAKSDTRANRVLLDLGVSSMQLDNPERGFSFMRDGPLDMRMHQGAGQSAADLVNTLEAEALADIFQKYGEERFSRRIAKRIVEAREVRPINTTGELSRVVASAVPGRGKIHPATRVFQALRMAVNDELGTLSRGLAAAGKVLAPGGRLAVLTFHSLEDRLVKKTFLRWRDLGMAELVTAKPIVCGPEEAKTNRRARSAKLRAVERR